MKSRYFVPMDYNADELRSRNRFAARCEHYARADGDRAAARYWRGSRAAIDRRIRELAAADAARRVRELAARVSELDRPRRPMLGDKALAVVLSLWILGAVAIASVR